MMKENRILKTYVLICFALFALTAQAQKQFTLISPDGKLQTTVSVGEELTYNIVLDGCEIMKPSPIALVLDNGEVWGKQAKLLKTTRRIVDEQVPAPFYRATSLRDNYAELVLHFKKDWRVEFRAYNDGIAYRFAHTVKTPFCIQNETVDFHLAGDYLATAPYVKIGDDGDFASQYYNSFENVYTVAKVSELKKGRLMFLPLVVDAGNGVKICFSESDLENYPGLFLTNADGGDRLTGRFAPCPKTTATGGWNNHQRMVLEREPYIAKVDAPRTFPWRMNVVSRTDTDLAKTNMSYLLASPSRIADTSWIKPGKVAWDWWNDWNIDGVDFVAGVNNATYKYYIDFASAHGIEYVILDEGWAVPMKADLTQVVDEIDLKELVDYATAKNVGIILWAGHSSFVKDMEGICRHFSEMGVKGFKVDFMDHDDQQMTAFNHRAAEICAKYHLVLDLHGTHKPAGLNRTWPNVLNFEGVYGLEQMKFASRNVDQVEYDVQIPFIRQVAGPMDYTQGAMRNATKGNFFSCNTEPMSQGTRCRQLALYAVLDSPINMMCDSPSNYIREAECTELIASFPTVWDETRVLDGVMGDYIVTARRKGNDWYVGGITDWTARDLTVDLSFLGEGGYQAQLFKDGANAHRIARDYKREVLSLDKTSKLNVHLAPGGGFALKLTR